VRGSFVCHGNQGLSLRQNLSRTPQLLSLGKYEALALTKVRHMTTKQTTQKSELSSTLSIHNHTTSNQGQSSSPVEETTQKITRKYIRGTHPARVTRISIEKTQNSDIEICKPRLKQGVQLSTPSSDENSSLILTSAHHAIVVHHPGARAIVAQLNGDKTAMDISSEIDAPIEVVEKVIEELKFAQLLDLKTSKIKLHNRFQSPIAERAANTEDQSNDASYKQLQIRMSSELNQTTWIDGVIDGGVELLSSRQNFGVEIHGGNRLATLIYLALLASGVTNTKFSIAARKDEFSIGDRDLGTGVLRMNDFGLNFKSRIDELSREWSLFPTASKNVKGTISAPIPERNLRVVVGDYSTELIELFMRDRQDHLFVGQVSGGAVYLGPMVYPGKSPCAYCLSSGKHERLGVEGLLPIIGRQSELPVSITYQLAGSAVQAILQLIDTGESDFTGAQMSFDYITPIRQEPVHIARHPKCRCQWSTGKNSRKSTSEEGSKSTSRSTETILF
jgi:hypothetical protein